MLQPMSVPVLISVHMSPPQSISASADRDPTKCCVRKQKLIWILFNSHSRSHADGRTKTGEHTLCQHRVGSQTHPPGARPLRSWRPCSTWCLSPRPAGGLPPWLWLLDRASAAFRVWHSPSWALGLFLWVWEGVWSRAFCSLVLQPPWFSRHLYPVKKQCRKDVSLKLTVRPRLVDPVPAAPADVQYGPMFCRCRHRW